MCLIPEKNEVTTEEKVVYVVRIIKKLKDDKKMIFSPIMYFDWKIGIVEEAENAPDEEIIGKGYFHVVMSIKDAKKIIKELCEYSSFDFPAYTHYCVCRSVIPLGTEIIYGKVAPDFYGEGLLSIATKKLKLIEIIDNSFVLATNREICNIKTISDMKRRNSEAGYGFFNPKIMEFFNARIVSKLYSGGYFIVSGRIGRPTTTYYTVMLAKNNGQVKIISWFWEFSKIDDAFRFVKECQREGII
jgi:hypothetical protein